MNGGKKQQNHRGNEKIEEQDKERNIQTHTHTQQRIRKYLI